MFPGKSYFKNGFHFVVLIHDIVFQITKKEQQNKSKQLFDGIIDNP